MDSNSSINDLFPSRFLKSTDIKDADLELTIKSVEMVEVGDERELKPVLYFFETDKGFVLNVTNGRTIAQMFGEMVAGWIGKKIRLFKTEIMYAGKNYWAIRVRLGQRRKFTPPPLPAEPEEFGENFEPEF